VCMMLADATGRAVVGGGGASSTATDSVGDRRGS